MSRPDPIEYAERLYAAIRDANFSTISFLAFGNAVKDGVDLRRMPRIAAEPFMRVVGEMVDLESTARSDETVIDADVAAATRGAVIDPVSPDASLAPLGSQIPHAAESRSNEAVDPSDPPPTPKQ